MHKNRIQAGEKPKDFKKSMGKMIRYIGSYKFAVLLVMIFAIGSTIFNVIGPKILGKIHHGSLPGTCCEDRRYRNALILHELAASCCFCLAFMR